MVLKERQRETNGLMMNVEELIEKERKQGRIASKNPKMRTLKKNGEANAGVLPES